ncbi:MAG: thiamine pyrophosphate-dependent enzyme [Alphaproteobacteria bacterium]|nr:thiamine pyrophosphate-dependent enzyme [Alphaproteobacteria bacterium]
MAMRRDDCLRVLARHRGDAIVVATYQAGFDWMRIAPHPLNYVSIGAMGQASSHALGLALGRPDKRVIVLDGDGSLLMNLGTLATIAAAAPANLIHFVCQNGCYEANGSHPLPNAAAIDFPAIARGAGIAHTAAFDDIAVFEAALPAFLATPGPVFAALHIVAGDPSPQDYAYIHSAEARRRFKDALTG